MGEDILILKPRIQVINEHGKRQPDIDLCSLEPKRRQLQTQVRDGSNEWLGRGSTVPREDRSNMTMRPRGAASSGPPGPKARVTYWY